ncbi:CoA-binding protein [Propionivibrio limicola]|uniref:CoA-binding protein n=1 Tax=Propionivibrio limicola TaxID=167645 RepID=UPI001290A88D|nr:CoA-binding protein [Propionivibrio limicola]
MENAQNVLVIGASNNEERYSNKAMKMLEEYGHTPIPVAPATDSVLGKKAYASAAEVTGKVDTVTLYVGPQRQTGLFEQLIALKPARVIFNPGTENPAEYDRLKAAGIEPIEACTLVMLRTGQF